MKKLICILLLVCMTTFAAAETIDLSGLSFDELMALRDQLSAELISRPEWKEVVVPSGTWVVGKDIPVGEYSLSPGNGGGYIRIQRNGRSYISQGIRDESDAFGKVELKTGDVIEIERGSIVFAPPVGLGF